MPLREKISTLVQKIYIFGDDRYISRIKKNTKEMNNIVIQSGCSEILKKDLTSKELKLFEKEKEIVYNIIFDQILETSSKLKDDTLTRQAIIYNRSNNKDEFPCISTIHFLVNNHRLNISVFMRSSNVEEMLFQDFYFIKHLASEVLGHSDLDLKLGRISIFISSAHIYE